MNEDNQLAKGCLLILPLPFLAAWFINVLYEVQQGGAPTWKVVVLISGFVIYGLVGGLAKAFEAGFSGKQFSSIKEEEIKGDTEEKFPFFMAMLVFVVLGGMFFTTFMIVVI